MGPYYRISRGISITRQGYFWVRAFFAGQKSGLSSEHKENSDLPLLSAPREGEVQSGYHVDLCIGHPDTSFFFLRISSISSAVYNRPLPAPGQVDRTSFSHTLLSMFSGQNGQVRHCQGRAS